MADAAKPEPGGDRITAQTFAEVQRRREQDATRSADDVTHDLLAAARRVIAGEPNAAQSLSDETLYATNDKRLRRVLVLMALTAELHAAEWPRATGQHDDLSVRDGIAALLPDALDD
jgi:hypothetical protein